MSSKINYTELERNVLLELVEARKDVIENKKNDGRMIGRKRKGMDRNHRNIWHTSWR